MSKERDAIVVGGGIMGTSVAYRLAGRGRRVLLVERRLIGDGPTGESSAILRTHYSNELTTRMARFGLEFYRDFETHTGSDCGFHAPGFLLLAPASDREAVARNCALQRRLGIASEVLDAAAIVLRMPGLRVDEDVVAAWEPDSGYADPYLAVTGLARAARERGAEILQDTAVTGIRLDGDGRVAGVETTRGGFDAPWVVNATGAWGRRTARLAGVEAPINACRVQVAVYRRPAPATAQPKQTAGAPLQHPIVADFRTACYFRPEVGDKTIAGLIDPAEAEAIVDPDDYPKKPDFPFYAELGEKLSRTFPAMESAESAGGYASLYAITPDWHPIIDEVPEGSGHVLCSGFSGHGFKLAPAVGVMVADMVAPGRATSDQDPRFDPSMFRLDRWRDRQQVAGSYRFGIVG
ncbi:MAG TPA: FAD-dependent oxidoreductase [Thermoanaerobaculia bacterium]|nr:FAD-dependent oxidoreductase [Thermoanaerobaculia bacterium]